MIDKSLIAAADALMRELNLPQNRNVNLDQLLDNSFERVSSQMLADLLALEQTVKGRKSPAIVPAVPVPKAPVVLKVQARTTKRKPARAKTSRRKPRVQSDNEKAVREALSDMDSVMECAKEVGYGTVTSIKASLPKNQFRTHGLVNQVWKKMTNSGLNSRVIRHSLVETLRDTLGKMVAAGKAEKEGYSRATRWVILK